jgi:phosphohistidine phosphatase
VHLYLVHHGEAVPAEIDPQRPLSDAGRLMVERLAEEAASRGVKPDLIWHSGKLRAKQTAEAFWRACNPLASMSAVRGLQPGDGSGPIRTALEGELRSVLIAGHFPHLPLLLGALLDQPADAAAEFPQHGLVVLESTDAETWRELWRSSGT